MPEIKYGATGDPVRLLQGLLNIKVDGIFGSQTTTAVKTFQKNNGLVVDGIVGAKTWKKLIATFSQLRTKINACLNAIEALPEFKALEGVI